MSDLEWLRRMADAEDQQCVNVGSPHDPGSIAVPPVTCSQLLKHAYDLQQQLAAVEERTRALEAERDEARSFAQGVYRWGPREQWEGWERLLPWLKGRP